MATLASDRGYTAPAGWTRAASSTNWSGTSEIWYYPNNPGGISGATFAASGTTYATGVISEWSGASGLDTVGTASNSSTATSSLSVSSAPVVATADLAVTAFTLYLNGGGALNETPGSGWTNFGHDSTGNWLHVTFDYLNGAAVGSATETETAGAAVNWTGAIALFRAANIAGPYTYDPFGVPTDTPTASPYGFVGRWQKLTDPLSGLIIMGARPYDPTLGRFLSVDPIAGGSANDYDYVNQDPVNGYDLSGRWWPRPTWKFRNLCWWCHHPAVQRAISHHNPFRSRSSTFAFAFGTLTLGVAVWYSVSVVRTWVAAIAGIPETDGASLLLIATTGGEGLAATTNYYATATLYRHAFNLDQ